MPLFQKSTEKIINNVVNIPTSAISPNRAQPRTSFDDYSLTQLAVSIQQNGILQPLTVRRSELGYELVAGERRLRAAKLLDIDYVPCIIIESSDTEAAVMAIMENIQRADLNYLEEAFSIQKLIEYYGVTQEEAALRLGIAQSTVANKLRLLKLSDEDKCLVLKYNLSERQARAILRLPQEKRKAALGEIYIRQMNTTQTDHYIDELLTEKPKRKIIRKEHPLKNIGLYLNGLSRTVDSMKMAGISCVTSKQQTDDEIVYTVRIPLR